MEHLDSQIQISPKRSRPFDLINEKTRFKGIFDSAFISILILFGVMGVMTILYLQAAKAASVQTDESMNLTTNRQIQESASPVFVSENQEEDHSFFASIEGPLKPKDEHTLIIDSYDPKATYVLDLGNGEKLQLNHKRSTFSYPGPGIYYPKIEVSYRQESETIPLEKIWIR